MKTTLANILMLIRQGRSDPRIREIAIKVITAADIAWTDYHNIIATIAQWVRQNVRFVEDPKRTDVIFPPLEVLDLGGADCEDHTTLAASLLQSIGLPVNIVIVSKTGEVWDHIFLRAFYPPDNPTNGLSVDTTIFPPSGSEIPYVDQKIYEVR